MVHGIFIWYPIDILGRPGRCNKDARGCRRTNEQGVKLCQGISNPNTYCLQYDATVSIFAFFIISIMQQIILASASPRRRQLLEWAEIPCRVMVSETDESFPEGLLPRDAAIHVARVKALAVASSALYTEQGAEAVILAADTMVVLGNEILGKPLHQADAQNTLRRLSGNDHRVMTGVCFLQGSRVITYCEETVVSFHHLTEEQILHYVDVYKPYDKAGAYAIQEWIGLIGIRGIQGDYYNVMGLPVCRVAATLSGDFPPF